VSRGNLWSATTTAIVATALGGLLWVLPLPLLLQSPGSLLISLAALIVLVSLRLPLGVVRATPSAGLAYLAHHLRSASFRVAEEPGKLTVRVGALLLLRFDARDSADGSEIRYRADLDPVGWAGWLLLMGLVILLLTGVPALLMVARLRGLEMRVLRPAIPADGVLPQLSAPDAARAALADGLAESHRLAAEAYEATRASYWDLLGITALVGILAGVVFLFAGLLLSPGPDAIQRATTLLPPAAALGAGVAAPLGMFVRRRVRPRLRESRVWAERLRAAIDPKTAGAPPPPGRSRFELLAEASRQVPGWLEARRRAGLSAEPGLFSLLWLLLGYEVELVVVGWWRVGEDPIAAAGAFAGSALLGIGLYVWSRRWARRQREAASRHLAAWNERFEGVRTQIEAYLRDL